MIRAKAADGSVDAYGFDNKGQMLIAAHVDKKAVITNTYFVDGHIKSQTMGDAQGFEYSYAREGGRILVTSITDPNGLETYVRYQSGGYLEWLPASMGH